MKFNKLQATGNDFILIDARNVEHKWSKLAQDMCQRHFGIGADGLILVMDSHTADFKMKIFNSDGSEAEACGNGLRCFAKYVIDYGIISKTYLTISTLAGTRTIEAVLSEGKVTRVQINMGKPYFKAEEIPVIIESRQMSGEELDIMPIMDYPLSLPENDLALSLISVGNPHAINFLTESLDKFPLSEIGPIVENHHIFPQKVNFEVARILNRNKIEARVWERGVGETLSCGSGACAIAVTARWKGHIDEEVDIILPGGDLNIKYDRGGEIYLTGPVEDVFSGDWLK